VTKVITSALFGKETTVCPFCAFSTMEASFDVASMCATSTKIFVLEVMGRHAGWIAAAGGLVDDSIPVVILFPEVDFDEEKFLAKVDANVKEFGYCTVVVSEGTKWADGRFLAATFAMSFNSPMPISQV
jgi:6-phosphofructokinase 1